MITRMAAFILVFAIVMLFIQTLFWLYLWISLGGHL